MQKREDERKRREEIRSQEKQYSEIEREAEEELERLEDEVRGTLQQGRKKEAKLELLDTGSASTDGSLSPSILSETINLVERRSLTDLCSHDVDDDISEEFILRRREFDHDDCFLAPRCVGQLQYSERPGINTATQTDQGYEHYKFRRKSTDEYLDDYDDDDEFFDVDDTDDVAGRGRKGTCEGNRKREAHKHGEGNEDITAESSSPLNQSSSMKTSEDDGEDFEDESFDEDFYTEDDISANMKLTPAKRRKLGSVGLERELVESEQIMEDDSKEETRTVIKGIRINNSLSFSVLPFPLVKKGNYFNC